MAKNSITFLLLFFLVPISAHGLQINSRTQTEITTNYVLLSDIVTFSEDSPLVSALGSTHICTAPDAGKSLVIQTENVQKKIARELHLEQDILWTGSRTTTVKRRGVVITADDIVSEIASFLIKNKVHLPNADYSFHPRELPLPFTIPLGDLEIQVIPSDPDIIGSRRFSLLYLVDGKTEKNISIRGQLDAMSDVAVLTCDVKRGTQLRPDMVRMERQNLSKLREPCTDLRTVLGKKVTKRLRNGAVLELGDIEFPPLIYKGQLVKMVVNHNGLHLTATGISHSNGKQNDIIRVKNLRSQKSVFCRVAGSGIVEVQI